MKNEGSALRPRASHPDPITGLRRPRTLYHSLTFPTVLFMLELDLLCETSGILDQLIACPYHWIKYQSKTRPIDQASCAGILGRLPQSSSVPNVYSLRSLLSKQRIEDARQPAGVRELPIARCPRRSLHIVRSLVY